MQIYTPTMVQPRPPLEFCGVTIVLIYRWPVMCSTRLGYYCGLWGFVTSSEMVAKMTTILCFTKHLN